MGVTHAVQNKCCRVRELLVGTKFKLGADRRCRVSDIKNGRLIYNFVKSGANGRYDVITYWPDSLGAKSNQFVHLIKSDLCSGVCLKKVGHRMKSGFRRVVRSR
jgi:hypothetical protein